MAYEKCIKIKDKDFLPFIYTTKNYGRAEFEICPQYKYGKLVKIGIYPRQQQDCSYYYEWEGGKKISLTLESYDKLQEPNIWRFVYCKIHKSQSMRVYVPEGANFLWFQEYSDNLTIGFTDKEFK